MMISINEMASFCHVYPIFLAICVQPVSKLYHGKCVYKFHFVLYGVAKVAKIGHIASK